ncbi:MAG TPA: DUF4382 domain-containing protein [Steroidobacteraceae bacterium]|nr:DUF4382 domain-containing protein [Steroidobacteraceae bacterium]
MNLLHVAERCWNAARQYSLRLFAVAGLSGALLVNACGGGAPMSMNPPPGSNTGTAMVTLTDMPGDFLSYMVNIVSLKLTRADGTTVETVPATTSVDFAQLVNLSEVISARQVPAGSYSGVAMTLDYSSATIVIDNGAGGITVPAANIINGGSSAALVSPNNQMTVTLQLPSGSPLVITDGTVSHLALDFNLSASNTVAPSAITSTTAASAVTVTVNPMLVASLTPDATKPIRVRGPLVSVTNTSSQTSYTVKVFPFFTDSDDGMGQVVVYTTATTAFTLNGTSSTGTAGLSALAALPTGTMTLALGTFDTTTRTFTAAQVFAGTSVPGAGLDSVEGTVVARSGDVLTVRHAFFEPEAGGGVQGGVVTSAAAGGNDTSMSNNTMGGTTGGGAMGTNMVANDFGFFGEVMVTVASTTTVSEDGQSGTFGPQDISVGQHVQAFGKAGTDASGNRTLDASAGSVRLMVTRAWGQYTSATGGVVTMNLQALDGLPPSAFNFAGTGTSGNDAAASAYTVSVPAALSLPALSAGFPIAFDGFVTPFGNAPPDFAAVTLVDFSTANAHLHLAWMEPGPTAPFVSPLSATNVMMTQATVQSAAQHVIFIGPVMEDPGSVSAGLSFVPSTAASNMIFAIGHRMSWQFQVYTSFSDFITALTGDLNGTTQLLGVDAQGPYDFSTGVQSVSFMAVVLSD